MRILWINHRDPKHPGAGGAEVHINEVGKRLVRNGHRVTLISERYAGSSPEDLIDGIIVKRIGNKYTIHLIALLLVRKMAERYDIIIDDIAHAVPWWSPLVTDKPVIGLVHHVHQTVADIELTFPLNLAAKNAEKSIKYTYDNIIAVSQTTRNDLVNILSVPESKVRVIYHGVDHELYRPVRERFREPTILWLGRIKKYKHIDDLLRAFVLVKRTLPNAKLIIAGTGDFEQEVKRLAVALGVTDVIFAGKVSEERKLELLKKCWVLAVTSVTEGWGMSVLEAAACGTPTVAYKAGALKEAVIDGKTGLLAEYRDVNSLAERLSQLLYDDDLREELCIEAFAYSQNFDWDTCTQQLTEYIRSIYP